MYASKLATTAEEDSTPSKMEGTSFLAGACAGITGLLFSHPFDTIRIRVQTTGGYTYRGVLDLFKGLGPPAVGVIAEKTTVFGTYQTSRNFFSNYGINETLNNVLSGAAAGVACSVIVAPVDRIKINLQDEKRVKSSSFSVIKFLYQRGGVSGLYKGFSHTLWREVPGYCLYLSMYQHIKDKWFDGNLTPVKSFLTGASTGAFVWAIIYPADAIKTRMQSLRTEGQYKNSADFLLQTFNKGGIRSIYSGFSLALMRAVPLHAGVILGYESSLNLLK